MSTKTTKPAIEVQYHDAQAFLDGDDWESEDEMECFLAEERCRPDVDRSHARRPRRLWRLAETSEHSHPEGDVSVPGSEGGDETMSREGNTMFVPVETEDQPRIHHDKYSSHQGENNWKRHKPITESIAWTWRSHRFDAPPRPIDEATRLRLSELCDKFYRDARSLCPDIERIEFVYPFEDARPDDKGDESATPAVVGAREEEDMF